MASPQPEGVPPSGRENVDSSGTEQGAVPMAIYEEVSVSGFEEFKEAVKQHAGKTIFAYFTGSKDAEGKSWCPDCVQGESGIGVLPRSGGKTEATTTKWG